MGSLQEGARNAVRVCMAVKRGERVVLVTDRPEREVGDALEAAAREAGATVQRFTLEDHGPRPMTELPDAVAAAAEAADVTFWAAASVEGELPARMRFRQHALKRARHAHMPGITRELMETGMCADYDEVAALTLRLFEFARTRRTARVTSPHGTDLTVQFHPEWRWLPDTGKFHTRGVWGNLPAGETYTAPLRLDGRLVTHLLGDHFSERYGKLPTPVSFEVRDSWIDLDTISGGTPRLLAELREYLLSDPNGARAGEFALGTNLALSDLVGNLLQDEKIPGVHIAFGHPYSDETGAPWTASTHIDCVLLRTSVWMDGVQIQEDSRYILENF